MDRTWSNVPYSPNYYPEPEPTMQDIIIELETKTPEQLIREKYGYYGFRD